jgi:hypothetical protein
MDVVLVILGVMGFGAVAVSTYVFIVAARNYVSEDRRRYRGGSGELAQTRMIKRSTVDRRSGRPVTFPLAVNGILVALDRRSQSDRRMAG